MITKNFYSRRAGAFSAMLLAMLAGCAAPVSTEPRLDYAPPTSGAVSSVPLDQPTVPTSVAAIAARLKAAGVTVVSADPAGGRIRARAKGPAFVDCGTLTQDFAGSRTAFPADAPTSVLFADGNPGGLLHREVDIRSDFDIRVNPETGRAEIDERHEIAVDLSAIDGSRRPLRESQVVSGDSTAKFANGVECRSSGLIAEIIAG